MLVLVLVLCRSTRQSFLACAHGTFAPAHLSSHLCQGLHDFVGNPLVLCSSLCYVDTLLIASTFPSQPLTARVNRVKDPFLPLKSPINRPLASR